MFRCVSTVVLLMLALAAPAAVARDVRIASQGPWAVDCGTEPPGDTWCQVGVSFESIHPAYGLQFNYVRDSRMFFAMGAPAPTLVRAHVDGQAPFSLERCLARICLVKGEAAERLLQQMLAGKSLVVEFVGGPGMPPPFTVDLAGFAPMYRRALAGPK
ncbi:MAG TPA: invasion associated locus B family protein [Reyranella sp.]|nr:invasion associated locus B family protein [Reyranella sp.]